MDILFSNKNNDQVRIIPVLPENMPEMAESYKNEVFESVKGDINLIGSKELRTVSLESFFPNKEYNFIQKGATSNGWDYVAFLNNIAENKEPIRMLWLNNDNEEITNMLYSIESFRTQIDIVGDIQYTLELKEYKEYD